MESKFLSAVRSKRLKELRSKLPVRCSFASTISENLAKQDIIIPADHIYQMVRGNRVVNENVLKEMQKLVQEMEDCEVSV